MKVGWGWHSEKANACKGGRGRKNCDIDKELEGQILRCKARDRRSTATNAACSRRRIVGGECRRTRWDQRKKKGSGIREDPREEGYTGDVGGDGYHGPMTKALKGGLRTGGVGFLYGGQSEKDPGGGCRGKGKGKRERETTAKEKGRTENMLTLTVRGPAVVLVEKELLSGEKTQENKGREKRLQGKNRKFTKTGECS